MSEHNEAIETAARACDRWIRSKNLHESLAAQSIQKEIRSLKRPDPSPSATDELAAHRETLQTLLDLLNPLHGSLDRQMYVDKQTPDFDPHPDDESDVIVTAKMERDLTQAVRIIESRLKDRQFDSGKLTATPEDGWRPIESRRDIQSWEVSVTVNGENVLTIGHNHLAGVEMTPELETAIEMAAHHLLSFLGVSALPAPSAKPEAQK